MYFFKGTLGPVRSRSSKRSASSSSFSYAAVLGAACACVAVLAIALVSIMRKAKTVAYSNDETLLPAETIASL